MSEQPLEPLIGGVADLTARLAAAGYLVDSGLATALTLAVRLRQPLLLEGEAGVGKTEAAKSLSTALNTPLIRLQCYEGVELSDALYEWNYPRQLLAIRLAEVSHDRLSDTDLFTSDYLVARPVLQALRHVGPRPAILLIDEVDRADDEFEAFLLEMLAESSVTIPELGTIRAVHPPIVVLTSNRTRDLHDALKRRCLYHWIDFPSVDRAAAIVRLRVPASAVAMAEYVAAAVARVRTLELQKPPGIAEAISWTSALDVLGFARLDETSAAATLATVVKYHEDLEVVRQKGLAWLVG